MTIKTSKERFHDMKDHDLLVQIAVKTEALEEHSAEQNDHIATLMEKSLKAEGAIDFGKWVLGITLGSAGLAGVIFFIVSNNGGV